MYKASTAKKYNHRTKPGLVDDLLVGDTYSGKRLRRIMTMGME